MGLTPADVHNVAFSKPPIGKRGYNEDEVDAFLDLIEAELARLIEENNEFRAQVEQLDQQLDAARSDLDGARTQLGSVDPAPSRRLAPVPPPSSMAATAPGGRAGHGGEGAAGHRDREVADLRTRVPDPVEGAARIEPARPQRPWLCRARGGAREPDRLLVRAARRGGLTLLG